MESFYQHPPKLKRQNDPTVGGSRQPDTTSAASMFTTNFNPFRQKPPAPNSNHLLATIAANSSAAFGNSTGGFSANSPSTGIFSPNSTSVGGYSSSQFPPTPGIKQTKKKSPSVIRKTWLFVENLWTGISEKDFLRIFSKYGDLGETFIHPTQGFAFVCMYSHANAQRAKEELNGKNMGGVGGKLLRVKYAAASGTAINVKNLSPMVSNELLLDAFSLFGKVERAVVVVDTNGRSTTRGIVEFNHKSSALNALQQIKEGCFLITSSPRAISCSLMEDEDTEDGLPEVNLTKSSLYKSEREAGPRFALPGSYEEQCARAWKAWDELERNQREQLERSLKASRETIELEIKNCRASNHLQTSTSTFPTSFPTSLPTPLQVALPTSLQTSHPNTNQLQSTPFHSSPTAGSFQMISPDVLRRQQQDEQRQLVEREERDRMEEERKKEMEKRRKQLEMAGRIWSADPLEILQSKEMEERQKRQKKILVAQIEWIKNPKMLQNNGHHNRKVEEQMSSPPNASDMMMMSPGSTPGSSGKPKRKKLKCPHCSKIYLFRKSLDTHMRSHMSSNDVKCEVCLKSFPTEREYNQHMLTHEGERNYKCPICDCKFIRLCSLKAHVLRHWNAAQNQKRPYGCEYCGKGFVDAKKLKAHVLQHTKEKVIKCPLCDQRFRIKNTLKLHMKAKHGNYKPQEQQPPIPIDTELTTAAGGNVETVNPETTGSNPENTASMETTGSNPENTISMETTGSNPDSLKTVERELSGSVETHGSTFDNITSMEATSTGTITEV